jgi:TonB family protein
MKSRAAFCLALLLATPLVGIAGEPAPPTLRPASAGKPTLADLDRFINTLRESHWQLPRMMGNPSPDASGRRPQDDMEEYILNDEVLRKITTLREELGKQEAAGAPLAVEEGDPLPLLLQSEMCRMLTISAYWGGRMGRDFHQDLIQRLITRLPEAERAAATGEVATIEASSRATRVAMVEGIKRCGDLKPGSVIPDEPGGPGLLANAGAGVDEYNALRRKLAARLDSARQESESPTRRSTPCPPPPPDADIKGTRAPKVRSQPDLRDYFPAEAINFKVTGTAKLRMLYDKTGCIIEVSVLESTGAEILDAAAMRIAFEYTLVPGYVDGKPVEGGVALPVNFNVRDMPMPNGGPAQPQP